MILAAGILPSSLAILSPPNHSLSSFNAITNPFLFRPFPISSFSSPSSAPPAIIRMGGGPRTFPGGVSKWQWKRMQAKKAQQLLKARLCRERQLYEMRKRAELKAAISELERPWEVVDRAPVLFSASADEQVKVLADRFQRPTGFDMWTERDGPQLFLSPDDLPSARFFPKGSVHSLKPYKAVRSDDGDGELRYDDWIARGSGGIRRGRRAKSVKAGDGITEEHPIAESREEKKEIAGLVNRYDRSHGRAGLTTDVELALPDLRLEGRVMAGGGNVSHGGNMVSYRSAEMSSGFNGRYRDSKMDNQKFPNEIDRSAGRRSRGGRDNQNRRSFRSHSTISGTDSGWEGGSFVGRSGYGHNGVSQISNSKFGVADSRIGGGRGGRRGRGGFRGSYRPYSELGVDNDSRIERGAAGNFGDQDGKRRLSRDPSSSASGHSIVPRRTEGDYMRLEQGRHGRRDRR